MLLFVVTVIFSAGYLVSARRGLKRTQANYRNAVERRLEAIRPAA